jgi:Leucine-rich repeat (LRR) protein
MSIVNDTLSSELLIRLGGVLLHSLWQFALIGLLLAAVLEMLRRRTAATRYLLCCTALPTRSLTGGLAIVILSTTITACFLQAGESETSTGIDESRPTRLADAEAATEGDDTASVRALVAKLRNEDIVWDGDFIGLLVREKSETAIAILKRGKAAIPALYAALDDAKRFAAVHVLLTLIDGDYKRTAGAWNGLHVKLHADGRQELFPKQIPDLKALWSRTLKSGVGLELQSRTKRPETSDKVALARTILANEKEALIADELVEQVIRKRINKPTGELTRADLKRVTVFDLRSPLLTDEGLKDVARLSQLSRLYLNETGITDEGLKELPRLELLTCLDLSSTKTTNAGLQEVARLKQLTELNLYNTQITDEGLIEVARLKQLTYLNLLGTRISDEGLKHVARLQQLDTLWLVGTRITDAGLREVAGLKKLTRLSLENTEITDVGLKDVAKLKQLLYLNLGATQITDASLNEMTRLQKLSHLNLSRCETITDVGLKELAELTQLTVLRLYGCTQITDESLRELATLNKLSYLDLQGTRITDTGLKELAELTQLSRLDLHGSRVTKAGVAELQKALPKCEINHNASDIDEGQFSLIRHRISGPHGNLVPHLDLRRIEIAN